ncbi:MULTISPECIES: transposase [Isoptericola]|uniref:transposase n=1 Tax=Isoptericola TaxID=254250 RepID=UPI000F650099|nr:MULTISPECIES: transposase [Isoptericola]MCK0117756.1 hypothetical protein [Isoptericola sp. S6320L]
MILPDWRHATEHIRDRQGRKGQTRETNIEPDWANEAYSDPEAVWFVPDPKGRKGMSNRTIGWSETAGFVITVVTVPDPEGSGFVWGASAWRSNPDEVAVYESKDREVNKEKR